MVEADLEGSSGRRNGQTEVEDERDRASVVDVGGRALDSHEDRHGVVVCRWEAQSSDIDVRWVANID